jgi:hypothetical protein
LLLAVAAAAAAGTHIDVSRLSHGLQEAGRIPIIASCCKSLFFRSPYGHGPLHWPVHCPPMCTAQVRWYQILLSLILYSQFTFELSNAKCTRGPSDSSVDPLSLRPEKYRWSHLYGQYKYLIRVLHTMSRTCESYRKCP